MNLKHTLLPVFIFMFTIFALSIKGQTKYTIETNRQPVHAEGTHQSIQKMKSRQQMPCYIENYQDNKDIRTIDYYDLKPCADRPQFEQTIKKNTLVCEPYITAEWKYAHTIDSVNRDKYAALIHLISKPFRLKELQQKSAIRILEHKNSLLHAKLSLVLNIILCLVCLLVAMVIFLYLRYKRRLLVHPLSLNHHKNPLKNSEPSNTSSQKSFPQESLNKEQLLFKQVHTVLWKEKLFTDPNFSREDLARITRSNRTYICEAIKACTDNNYSVSEYINHQRLEYACTLLESASDLSIQDVSIHSGFTSSRTFLRLFKAKYKQTPSEYKKSIVR